MEPSPFNLPVQKLLDRLHARMLPNTDGRVADYIPELAKTDPDLFGIALVSLDGNVYQSGDTQHGFTIQSISKPLTFGLALSDQGSEQVSKFVGVEPTGDVFNSISLEPGSGRPLNPMINAGAIATAGLIKGDSGEERFQRLLDCYSGYAGRKLGLDEEVYHSEKTTGHRNRAIAHLLRNFDVLVDDPEPHLDLYFRQCSVEITCRDLAVIGATMANYGVNPITGLEVVKPHHAEKVLSVMTTCGMYDYSGTWIYDVGLPAKSGVGGGIVAVLPGQFGLAVFSPRLDAKGNSVRGIKVCEAISSALHLHIFHGLRGSPSAIRSQYDATEVSSRRDRPPELAALIEIHGKNIRIFELQGDLGFATTEHLTREVVSALDKSKNIILGLRRVMNIDLASCQLLADLYREVTEKGGNLLFTQLTKHFRFRQFLIRNLGEKFGAGLVSFSDVDHALEWCEDQLIVELEEGWVAKPSPGLAAQEMLSGFTAEEFDALSALMTSVKFPKGETILREGDSADSASECLYFITEGMVNVNLALGRKQIRRLARLSAGRSFGEMAMLDHEKRSASIVTETDVTCRVLVFGALDDLEVGLATRIKLKLLRNLGCLLSRKLRRANQEIRALS